MVKFKLQEEVYIGFEAHFFHVVVDDPDHDDDEVVLVEELDACFINFGLIWSS